MVVPISPPPLSPSFLPSFLLRTYIHSTYTETIKKRKKYGQPKPVNIQKLNKLAFDLHSTMSSIIQSIQKRTSVAQSLPLSNSSAATGPTLRRRLSSLSLNPVTSSPATSWPFRRSKSLSSMGEAAGTSIKIWWDWGWTWILSRRPVFGRDLEISGEERRGIGSHSLRHVFFRVRSEIRRLVRSGHDGGLPQTCRGTI